MPSVSLETCWRFSWLRATLVSLDGRETHSVRTVSVLPPPFRTRSRLDASVSISKEVSHALS
jgi:hypothetical protein